MARLRLLFCAQPPLVLEEKCKEYIKKIEEAGEATKSKCIKKIEVAGEAMECKLRKLKKEENSKEEMHEICSQELDKTNKAMKDDETKQISKEVPQKISAKSVATDSPSFAALGDEDEKVALDEPTHQDAATLERLQIQELICLCEEFRISDLKHLKSELSRLLRVEKAFKTYCQRQGITEESLKMKVMEEHPGEYIEEVEEAGKPIMEQNLEKCPPTSEEIFNNQHLPPRVATHVTQNEGGSQTVVCCVAEDVQAFMEKLEVKSTVKISDFERLKEEWKKCNRDNVPSYLDYIVESIGRDIIGQDNPFSEHMIARPLALFYATIDEMHNSQLLDIDEDKMLKWGFVIKDALGMRMDVGFAMEHLKNIAHEYFVVKALDKKSEGAEILSNTCKHEANNFDGQRLSKGILS